jgi:hypothetical protein
VLLRLHDAITFIIFRVRLATALQGSPWHSYLIALLSALAVDVIEPHGEAENDT